MTSNTKTDTEMLRIGLVSISDRATAGVYEDQGIPALQAWFGAALSSPWQMETRLIPDDRAQIEQTLIELCDQAACDLILTTGGTGPARRDVTPEATLAVASKEMPGFGEQMRQISLKFVPTAILSRQVAVIRETANHAALIMNLPGQPKSHQGNPRRLEGCRRQTTGGRHLCCRALLHRSDRRPVHRDQRWRLQGVSSQIGHPHQINFSLFFSLRP